MKKLISVLLCAALIFGASINLSLNSMRPQAADSGAAEFAENVGEMLRDFDEPSDIGAAVRSQGLDPAKTRLIVKAGGALDTLDAVSVAENDGLWVLQFADRAAAEKAYTFYSSNKKVKYVEYDCSVSAVDYEEESGGVEHGGAEAPAQPAGKFLS